MPEAVSARLVAADHAGGVVSGDPVGSGFRESHCGKGALIKLQALRMLIAGLSFVRAGLAYQRAGLDPGQRGGPALAQLFQELRAVYQRCDGVVSIAEPGVGGGESG